MAKEANAQAVGVSKESALLDGMAGSSSLDGSDTRDAESFEMEARGRMLTEYGDLRRRLAGLMADASRVGAEFQELSNQLRMCPNVVSIEGLITSNSNKPAFEPSLFDADHLVALVSEIRQTIDRKNEIQERLQDMGILDAYGQFRY